MARDKFVRVYVDDTLPDCCRGYFTVSRFSDSRLAADEDAYLPASDNPCETLLKRANALAVHFGEGHESKKACRELRAAEENDLENDAVKVRATPHKARLAALHKISLHIFRHIVQKIYCAAFAQALCGVALDLSTTEAREEISFCPRMRTIRSGAIPIKG